jgi:hypothetical protein
LHANTEHEGATDDCDVQWRNTASKTHPPNLALRDQWCKYQYCNSEHDHLCTQSGASTCANHFTPSGSETKSCMVKNNASSKTDYEQSALAPAVVAT